MPEAEGANREDEVVWLPPGFRFHPTDEEIITSYLTEKVKNASFTSCAIAEADFNKCEPWDLPCKFHAVSTPVTCPYANHMPDKAKMGEKEWYFFCQRDRKYPTGMRTNRATEAGYWKATGKDKEIYRGKNTLVGMKKTLVFYRGRAPKGAKTSWVMHEYRLEGQLNYYTLSKSACDEWVVCRVFHKNPSAKRPFSSDDELFNQSSPPPLMDSCFSKSTAESIVSRSSGQMGDSLTQYFNGYVSSNVEPYIQAQFDPLTSMKEKHYFKEEQLSPDHSAACFSSTLDPFGNKDFESLDPCFSNFDYYFMRDYS